MDMKEKARWLGQLSALRREVDMLSQRIAELELAAQGGVGRITGMPRGGAQGDRTGEYATRIAELRDRMTARRLRCMEQLGALYDFIDGIGDSRMRLIMGYRYIDGDTWQRIATRIGETDEQYPRRLHNRFLRETEMRIPAIFDEKDEADVIE